MIERRESQFLMTSAQHRQWARIVRTRGRPDLAFHHEQLARVIERLEQREAMRLTVTSPPIRPRGRGKQEQTPDPAIRFPGAST